MNYYKNLSLRLVISLAILIFYKIFYFVFIPLTVFFVGSLLILAMNLIRIDVLIIVLIEKGVNYFETLHLFFWKILSSVYVALVWIFMTYKFKVKEIPVVDDFKTLKKKIR